MDPFIHNLSCVMICKGTLFYWYSEVTILHVWAFLTFGLSLLVTFNYYKKKQTNKQQQKRYIIQPYRLKLYFPFPQRIYKVLEIT